MKKEEIIGNALIVVGGVLCIKYVVIPLINFTCAGIEALQIQRQFNKKMKQGLRDGSIIKIDGQYYEVRNESINLPVRRS